MPNNLVIRFVSGAGFVSAAIRYVTNAPWIIHVEAQSRDGNAWTGAHAGSGVQPRPLDYCNPRMERRYFMPVTQSEFDRAHTWLESKIGEKYDYLDILGLALKHRVWNPHRVICSVLMMQFMQQAGMEPLNVLAQFDALITPDELHMSNLFIGRSRGF
jgi:hypothetical protein